MSIHNYTRAAIEDRWDVDAGVITGEVQADLSGKAFTVMTTGTTLTFDFDEQLTDEEITTLAGRVTTHKAARATALILSWKAQKNDAIDARTRELIDEGVELVPASGLFVSGSIEAQQNFERRHKNRNDATVVTYPIKIAYKDNGGTRSITTAGALDTAYLLYVAAIEAQVAAGSALKDTVNTKTSRTDVFAVADTR